MSESTKNKKSKKSKIIIGIVSLIGIAIIAVAIYWFSLSSEQRNMVLFMAAKGDSYDSYQEYQVIDRNDEALAASSFEPSAAEAAEGSDNTNILAITEMVKNEDSKMLKKGNVETIGVEDYTGWHLIADEGTAADDVYPFGPSPLSYYTSGLAANLHIQIIKAAEVKGVELDSVKVEVLNTFHWDDMMSDEGAGFLDLSTTNIIIESDASEEVIQEIKELALKSWTAGEALKNETVIEPTLVINGENWENYRSIPGTTLSEKSFAGELEISSVTDIPVLPEYLEHEVDQADEGFSFDSMTNLNFEIFAIAESAGNSERPYLTKIILSTPSAETWEIYSDEFMGENDLPLAPTSLEYFTSGTSLCLTSQMTLVSSMMGLDFTEYRVEQQIDYRQENVNTTDMAGYTDTAHSYVLIESDESQERLETFYNKALALCFAGEGLKGETEMEINTYLNGDELK